MGAGSHQSSDVVELGVRCESGGGDGVGMGDGSGVVGFGVCDVCGGVVMCVAFRLALCCCLCSRCINCFLVSLVLLLVAVLFAGWLVGVAGVFLLDAERVL